MASKLCVRLRSHLFRNLTLQSFVHHRPPIISIIESPPTRLPIFYCSPFALSNLRCLSIASRRPVRPKKVDIAVRARQLQTRRLWAYAITISCMAGFLVLVLSNFQDDLVFYLTPTDAMEKFVADPSKKKFRLGGLVLEGSVVYEQSSPEMEFVITDLLTDILVRYQGPLPDLFREGHSAVIQGTLKPFSDDIRYARKGVSEKARSGDCYFAAVEVLAKHDEKYMPPEVAEALEKNKKKIAEREGALVGSQKS